MMNIDKYVIYINNIGYYTGKTFKHSNAKQEETLYPYTTKDTNKAKQYSSYDMALRGMNALKVKCDIPSCVTMRLSCCE